MADVLAFAMLISVVGLFSGWQFALLAAFGIGVFALIARTVAVLFPKYFILAFVAIFVLVPTAYELSNASSVDLTQYGGSTGFVALFVKGSPTVVGLTKVLISNVLIALALVFSSSVTHLLLKQSGVKQ